MRPCIVAGNWKLQGSLEFVTAYCAELKQCLQQVQDADQSTLILLPPAIFLPFCQQVLSGVPVALGAQDVSLFSEGAYTGEISASMLASFARYVLVGHSERRHLFAETNEQVAAKFCIARQVGMRPILCVGETQAQRERGEVMSVIQQQVQAVLDLAGGVQPFEHALIAYEPVWAIGTGLTASPEQAQQVQQKIRSFIAQHDAVIAQNLPILYGGSVKVDNAQQLLKMPDIDGALVGGASLAVDSLLGIRPCKILS